MSTNGKATEAAALFSRVLTERVQPAFNYDDAEAVAEAVRNSHCTCYTSAITRLKSQAARVGATSASDFLKNHVRTAEDANQLRLIFTYEGVCKLHAAAMWLQVQQSVRDAYSAKLRKQTI